MIDSMPPVVDVGNFQLIVLLNHSWPLLAWIGQLINGFLCGTRKWTRVAAVRLIHAVSIRSVNRKYYHLPQNLAQQHRKFRSKNSSLLNSKKGKKKKPSELFLFSTFHAVNSDKSMSRSFFFFLSRMLNKMREYFIHHRLRERAIQMKLQMKLITNELIIIKKGKKVIKEGTSEGVVDIVVIFYRAQKKWNVVRVSVNNHNYSHEMHALTRSYTLEMETLKLMRFMWKFEIATIIIAWLLLLFTIYNTYKKHNIKCL